MIGDRGFQVLSHPRERQGLVLSGLRDAFNQFQPGTHECGDTGEIGRLSRYDRFLRDGVATKHGVGGRGEAYAYAQEDAERQ